MILCSLLQPLAGTVLSLFTQHVDVEVDLEILTSLLKKLLMDSYEVTNLREVVSASVFSEEEMTHELVVFLLLGGHRCLFWLRHPPPSTSVTG